MNPLLMRILSGAILVAVMTAMILFSVDTLLILALVLAAVTIPEFFRLVFPQDKGVTGLIQHFNTILVSWLMIFTTYLVVWTAASARWYLILLPVVFSLMALNMFNKRDGSPVRRIGTQITVLVYIGIPLSLLVGLGADRNEMGVMAYNSRLVLFYFILIWVNDIG
ncbi:MAG: hypothetical protein LUD68_08065, partial [Rikenellaceae bacterium]|nr:hypothetical protein [Rikenellaceae bacterium]